MKLSGIILLSMLITGFAFGAQPVAFRDGDLVFQFWLDQQGVAVQRATHSLYTHVGIVFLVKGRPQVYEAIGPVKWTPMEDWIKQGKDSHYVVKRLKNADKLLTVDAIKKLRATAVTFKGKPYDFTFEWSDDRLYCSELVWKIYDRALGVKIGKTQKLGDFDLTDPQVKQLMKERYGNKPPLDMTVISPGDIFENKDLVTIGESPKGKS